MSYKIKDSINLEQLEDLGFKKSETMLLPRYTRNYAEVFFDLPEKWLNDETDQYRIKHKLPLIHNRSIIFEADVREEYKESLIYDLIKLGFVEEIER